MSKQLQKYFCIIINLQKCWRVDISIINKHLHTQTHTLTYCMRDRKKGGVQGPGYDKPNIAVVSINTT